MKRLEKFVDDNFERFSCMEENEVCELNVNYLDNEIVEYLKGVDRFDYKGICVYYVEEENEVWVENGNEVQVENMSA